MLTVILLFVRAFSNPLNPIQRQIYDCESIGTDYQACEDASMCKFYKISTREAWDINEALQVAVKAADGESFAWYDGTVTGLIGDQLTLTVPSYDCGEGCVKTVSVNRFSFELRKSSYEEFVGMGIQVWRNYFNRWIPTNLTSIEADDWSNLWAYGGDFGDIVNLQPFDVVADQRQHCKFDPSNVYNMSRDLAQAAGQVPDASYCTQVYKEELCSDGYNLNCEWNSTAAVCLLNQETNDLISCWNYGDRQSCEDETQHLGLKCKWLAGDKALQEDALCVNNATSISLLLVGLLIAFMF